MIRTRRSTTTCRRSALEGCRCLQSQNATWPRRAEFSLPDGTRNWLRNELGLGTGLQLQPGIAIGDRTCLRKHLATRAPASGLAQCKARYTCVKAFAHGVARPICAREPGPRAFLCNDADVVPLVKGGEKTRFDTPFLGPAALYLDRIRARPIPAAPGFSRAGLSRGEGRDSPSRRDRRGRSDR